MNFSKDILKIKNGTEVCFYELERQEKIYKEYIRQGRESEYDSIIGKMQVIRENPFNGKLY
jgi:hypothetical protein